MKRKYLSSLALVFLFAGCKPDVLPIDYEDLSLEDGSYIVATLPSDPSTRLSLLQDDFDIVLIWEEGDEIELCFVQGETKIRQVSRVGRISSNGKSASFPLIVPQVLLGDTYDLYGVHGGGGLSSSDPSITLLPDGSSSGGSLVDVSSRKDVMLYFTKKGIEKNAEEVDIKFIHLGSLFNVSLSNSSDSSFDNLGAVRLVGPSGSDGWAYNSSVSGDGYDLINEEFLGTDNLSGFLSFQVPNGAVPPGETVSLWGWYPPLPSVVWPELTLELVDTSGDVLAVSTNRKPAREKPTAVGRAFYFVADWNGESLRFNASNDSVFGIDNGLVSLQFTLNNNNKLEFIEFSSQGENWLDTESTSSDYFWSITFTTERQEVYQVYSHDVDLKHAEKNPSTNSLHFEWEFVNQEVTGGVHATVKLDNSTNLTEWDLSVDIPDGWTVLDVVFPRVRLVKHGGMNLISPRNWGVRYELDGLSSFTHSNIYPSSQATVQMMALNRNKNAFYFATHDRNANMKTFTAQVSPANVVLSVDITPSEGWIVDGEFSIPWTASLGVHSNGWEASAIDWYRPFALSTEWGKKTHQQKQTPRWLLDNDLWLTGGRDGADEVDALTRTLDYFGDDTKYHWYYWFNHDFDTNYPEFQPPRPDYHRIVGTIQEHGSKVMPYTNGRLWDISTPSYQSLNGPEQAVMNRNGQIYTENYVVTHAVACPSTQVWNDVVTGFTQEILYGPIKNHALYFDQVASARALPCYNPNHDHPAGGGDFWHYSTRKIYKNVDDILTSEHAIATEQNAECFIDLFDFFLMGNSPPRPSGAVWGPAPLFPIIYSDRVVTYGFYLHNPSDANYFRLKNALTLLWGAQLSGGRSVLYRGTGWQANAAFLKGLKDFRKNQHDLFVSGRMLGEYTPGGDNPEITVDEWNWKTRVVVGSKWLSSSGREVVLLVNIDSEDHEIILPTRGSYLMKPGECLRINLDGGLQTGESLPPIEDEPYGDGNTIESNSPLPPIKDESYP